MNDPRVFRCVLEGVEEKARVADVLVLDDEIFLVVQGKRAEPYVFHVRPAGLRGARRDKRKKILEMHQEEVEQWQKTSSSEPVASSPS